MLRFHFQFISKRSANREKTSENDQLWSGFPFNHSANKKLNFTITFKKNCNLVHATIIFVNHLLPMFFLAPKKRPLIGKPLPTSNSIWYQFWLHLKNAYQFQCTNGYNVKCMSLCQLLVKIASCTILSDTSHKNWRCRLVNNEIPLFIILPTNDLSRTWR